MARRHLGRRAVLRALCGTSLATLAGCPASSADPSLSVPESALTDDVVRVVVEGLSPGERISLRATANARDGAEWVAAATFEADDDGTVDLVERGPRRGAYSGVDPMGLFWSMRPSGASPGEPLPPEALFVPDETGYGVELTVERDGATAVTETTTRRLYDPAVERVAAGDGLVGDLYLPPGTDAVPGIVHLHGAGGRPHRATGRLLASRGFAALTLRYFGPPDPIPDTLSEVPVEYVQRALAWLRRHPRVAASSVGLFGYSRGGSLALLVGSLTDGVGAVVGWVPSGIVWEGLTYGRAPAGTAAWSVGGEPVPYLELASADPGPPPTPALPFYEPALAAADEDEVAAASIRAEEMAAPVFLVSATDDRRWPSSTLAHRVVERLDAADYAPTYRHDSHEGAGHYLRLPFLPTAGVCRDERNVYGGSQVPNARAAISAWSETVAFLRDSLGAGP